MSSLQDLAVTTYKSNSVQHETDSSNPITFNSVQAMMANPLVCILCSEQFPDVLQNYTTENSRLLLNALYETASGNAALINKKGPLGGYTALHWMCIKNELELIELLLVKCKADVNCKANLGETPLLICIK